MNIKQEVISDSYRRKTLASPSKGRSLGETVKSYSAPVKYALSILLNSLPKSLYCPNILKSKNILGGISEDHNLRFSWFLINICILYGYQTKSKFTCDVGDSLYWFFGGDTDEFQICKAILEKVTLKEVETVLSTVELDLNFLDLYPYVIEPHGHITRGELERNAQAIKLKQQKQKEGVYYTPSDVAEFMVNTISSDLTGKETWLDPACGTGVFLREIMLSNCNSSNTSRLEFCQKYLYGIDKSSLCTESCAFVLLNEGSIDSYREIHSPFNEWEKIKSNLLVCDSLQLNKFSNSNLKVPIEKQKSIFQIIDYFTKKPYNDDQTNAINLLKYLLNNKFDRIVMNPPYSTDVLSKNKQEWSSFENLKTFSKINICLPFAEMMTDFLVDNGISSGVFPLSVGTSTQKQFKNCRKHLLKSDGQLDFLFFDREPHSLFGEDIKTRNAIIIYRKRSKEDMCRTSNLLKWTSDNRNAAFNLNRLVPIPKSYITEYIPKIGSKTEFNLFRILEKFRTSNQIKIEPVIKSVQLSDIYEPNNSNNFHCASTAYNFLNCFFYLPKKGQIHSPLSNSSVICLSFSNIEQAMISYSLLTSRIAFWLWRIKCDGFHVTQSFIKHLPLWYLPFTKEQLKILSTNGKEIWDECCQSAVPSINGGKLTYSFHTPFQKEPQMVNELQILKTIGVDRKIIVPKLDHFFRETVLIDGKNRRLKQ